jgi:hypothetical protein
MLSNKLTAAKTYSGTVIRVWVICASLLCCVASKLTHVAQPILALLLGRTWCYWLRHLPCMVCPGCCHTDCAKHWVQGEQQCLVSYHEVQYDTSAVSMTQVQHHTSCVILKQLELLTMSCAGKAALDCALLPTICCCQQHVRGCRQLSASALQAAGCSACLPHATGCCSCFSGS